MRRTNILLGAAAAIAMSVGMVGAANATEIFLAPGDTIESALLGHTVTTTGAFSDIFVFDIPDLGSPFLGEITFDFTNTATINTPATNQYHKAGDLDFTSIYITAPSFVTVFGSVDNLLTPFVGTGSPTKCAVLKTCYAQSHALIDTSLAPGQYTLHITGTTYGRATYGGQVNWAPPPPVPEPAAWALMILGLGGMGTALRGRRGAATTFA